MNKKSLLMMMVTICLIAVVGVGATLAYLSDATGPVTNTFTFVQNGIDITLDEAPIGDDNKKTDGPRVTSNTYDNIVPGMLMDKDPTVTVIKNSVNCHVFVSVTNANKADELKIMDLDTNKWMVVDLSELGFEGADNTTYYVYAGTNSVDVEDSDYNVVENNPNADVKLDPVFTQVKVGDVLEPNKEADGTYKNPFTDIIIQAAAVQADSWSDEEAVKAALGMLGATKNATEDGE